MKYKKSHKKASKPTAGRAHCGTTHCYGDRLTGLLHNHKQIKFLPCAFSLCKFWLTLTVILNLAIFNFSQRIFALTSSYCKSSSLRSSGLSVTIRARFCLKNLTSCIIFYENCPEKLQFINKTV